MLVLTRKVGQRLMVPKCELAVTILAVRGGQVRLGISAPADVEVYREEVLAAADRLTYFPPEQHGGAGIRTPMRIDQRKTVDRDAKEADAADTLAAELTEAAYFVVLQHGVVDECWIDMKLELWDALAETVRKWLQELPVATVES
jgi:carbon storage regulator